MLLSIVVRHTIHVQARLMLGGVISGRFALVTLLFAVTVLHGCSTGAQIEASRMRSVAAEANQAAKSCYERIWSKPDYVDLKTRLYLKTDSSLPLEYTTNKGVPTKHDIALIYRLHADTQGCRKIILDSYAKVHPLLLMLTLVQSFSEKDKVWIDAVNGRLTWGQFNQALKEIGEKAQAAGLRAASQIDAQLQNQHAFELEQRQRAAEAFQQWAYQQQVLANQRAAIAAANRPATINCNYFGNTAQCTSF